MLGYLSGMCNRGHTSRSSLCEFHGKRFGLIIEFISAEFQGDHTVFSRNEWSRPMVCVTYGSSHFTDTMRGAPHFHASAFPRFGPATAHSSKHEMKVESPLAHIQFPV